jgi:hypothetical protein
VPLSCTSAKRHAQGVTSGFIFAARTDLHSSSHPAIYQHLHIHATVFGSSVRALIGCHGIGFAHRPWSYDVAERDMAVLKQIRHNLNLRELTSLDCENVT